MTTTNDKLVDLKSRFSEDGLGRDQSDNGRNDGFWFFGHVHLLLALFPRVSYVTTPY